MFCKTSNVPKQVIVEEGKWTKIKEKEKVWQLLFWFLGYSPGTITETKSFEILDDIKGPLSQPDFILNSARVRDQTPYNLLKGYKLIVTRVNHMLVYCNCYVL